MARYQDPTQPRGTFTDNLVNILALIVIVGGLFFAWPFLLDQFKARVGLAPAATEQPTVGAHPAVGNQAPPAVRSTNPDAPAAAPALPNVAQNDATAQVLYQAAIDAQNGAQVAPTPIPAPLPINSAGQPIIDRRQQQQLDQSAQMAAEEAAAAVRAAQLADAADRPPDVSADQVATMTGRNPCSVPHSDPQTCASGLYKPTPVNP